MNGKDVKNVYGAALSISFLSTGMMALITFPRSLHLVDLGISVALYGLLISFSNGINCIFSIISGWLIDKYHCLEQILKVAMMISIAGHLAFAITTNPSMLIIAFVLEMAAHRIFTGFIFRAIEPLSKTHYGTNLGLYKLAGSVAWVLFAAASGYLIKAFSFRFLVMLVIGMGIMKSCFLYRLLAFYHNNCSAPTPQGRQKHITLSFGLMNLMVLYMLMQFQSNGGFSYLQIYFSKELGLDNITSGIIISASGFFEIMISLFIGKCCDISVNAAKRVMIAGCLLAAVRWLIIARADSVMLLVFTQFLHGIMICTISITFMSYLSRIVKEELMGTMMGVMGALSSLGTIFGSGIFGFFSERYTLKAAYLGLGVVSVAGVLIYILLEGVSGYYIQTRCKRHLS